MKKIDFTNVEVQVSFNGTKRVFNIARVTGNAMRFTGSVIGDIGFDKLAEKIYFSDGEVEIPDEYVKLLLQVISEAPFMASIKRTLTEKLSE